MHQYVNVLNDKSKLFSGCTQKHTHLYVQYECIKSNEELKSVKLKGITVIAVCSVISIAFILSMEYV